MPVNGFFLSQIDKVQGSIVAMGEQTGTLLGNAVAAVMAKDAVLAQEVIQADSVLDRMEDDHEETIIHLIALHQPVARDLRRLVAFLRVNSTIERIGDLAVNIAQAAIRISDVPSIRPFVDIPRSYELVRSMLDDSIRCFDGTDDVAAAEFRRRDDVIDRLNQETILQLISISREHPDKIFQATNFIGISKSLERVADLTVDIADEVIYARRGELRHARALQKDSA